MYLKYLINTKLEPNYLLSHYENWPHCRVLSSLYAARIYEIRTSKNETAKRPKSFPLSLVIGWIGVLVETLFLAQGWLGIVCSKQHTKSQDHLAIWQSLFSIAFRKTILLVLILCRNIVIRYPCMASTLKLVELKMC